MADSVENLANQLNETKLNDSKTEEQPAPPLASSQVMTLIQSCIDEFHSEAFLQRLANAARSAERPRPAELVIGMQTERMQALGIEPSVGVKCLKSLPQFYPSETELIEKANEFRTDSQEAFLKYLIEHPMEESKLQTEGKLTRTQVLNFIDTCNTMMRSKGTKQALREFWEQNQQPPNHLMIQKQREILNYIGIEPEFGISELNQLSVNFPGDTDLFNRLHEMAATAQRICTISMADDADERNEQILIELQAQQGRVLDEIQNMSEQEIQVFVQSAIPKYREVLMRMSSPNVMDKLHVLKTLSQQEKIEMLKLQMIMSFSQPHQHGPNCQHHQHQHHGHGHGQHQHGPNCQHHQHQHQHHGHNHHHHDEHNYGNVTHNHHGEHSTENPKDK